MVDKITYEVSDKEDQEAEEVDDDNGKSEPPATFLSRVGRISTAWKYLMWLHVENKMMAALSGTENDYTLFSTK
jgi:hypothetical protein